MALKSENVLVVLGSLHAMLKGLWVSDGPPGGAEALGDWGQGKECPKII